MDRSDLTSSLRASNHDQLNISADHKQTTWRHTQCSNTCKHVQGTYMPRGYMNIVLDNIIIISLVIVQKVKPISRPERLIDLIVNHDYWEIIDVQTIIVMSISYILSKEIPSETLTRL